MPYEKSAKNKQILIEAREGNPKNGRPPKFLYQAGPQKGTKAQEIFLPYVPFGGLISWFDVVLEKLDDVFSGGAR